MDRWSQSRGSIGSGVEFKAKIAKRNGFKHNHRLLPWERKYQHTLTDFLKDEKENIPLKISSSVGFSLFSNSSNSDLVIEPQRANSSLTPPKISPVKDISTEQLSIKNRNNTESHVNKMERNCYLNTNISIPSDTKNAAGIDLSKEYYKTLLDKVFSYSPDALVPFMKTKPKDKTG